MQVGFTRFRGNFQVGHSANPRWILTMLWDTPPPDGNIG